MDPLWETLKGNLQEKISALNFNTWFKPIKDGRLEEDRFILTVPNKFVADWIVDYYIELLTQELNDLTGKEIRLQFEFDRKLDEASAAEAAAQSGNGNGETHAAGNGYTNGHSEPQQQPIDSITNDLIGHVPAKPLKVKPVVSSSLNPKYNFDSFVVGSGNQLAYAASRAVAELPGGHYNPLFLYGGVGLGKTHIMHAIGLEVSHKRPDLKIIYCSSEKFMNELINSIRYERMDHFRKKYRETCDILLIDDIQFIAGKERTQEEFFHTFNTLYEGQKQLVVTSDKTPKEIPGLEERLRSRFEWGLIADIQAPDFETRVAILQKNAEREGIFLPNDVSLFLAKHIRSNVRELEGSLIRLHAFASLTNSPITLDLAKEVLQNLFKQNEPSQSTIETIQKVVAEFYQVKMVDLKSGRRFKGVVRPRQVAMYLCKKHLNVSFPEIGSKFGGKDHTTVMHAFQKITKLCNEDSQLRNEIEDIEKSILHY